MTEHGDVSLTGCYAGFASRLSAFVVDLGVLTVLGVVTAWITVEVLQFFGIDVRDCESLASVAPYRWEVCRAALIAAPLIGTGFALLYRVFFWSTTGQTPGMAALGLRVVRMDGNPMTFVTASRRLGGYLLSTFSLGAGFAVILTDDRRRGWHDRIAGTYVIYAWEARKHERFLASAHARLDRGG